MSKKGYDDTNDRKIAIEILKKEINSIDFIKSNPVKYEVDLIGKNKYGEDIYADVETSNEHCRMWKNDGVGLTTLISKLDTYAKPWKENFYLVYLMVDENYNYLGKFIVIDGKTLLDKAILTPISKETYNNRQGHCEIYNLKKCIPGWDYFTNVGSDSNNADKNNMNVIGRISTFKYKEGNINHWCGNLTFSKRLYRKACTDPNAVYDFYEHDLNNGRPNLNAKRYIRWSDLNEIIEYVKLFDEKHDGELKWKYEKEEYYCLPLTKLLEKSFTI